MSIQEKIDSAQPTTWLTDGISKWKVRLIIWWAQFKARRMVKRNELRRQKRNNV